MRRIPRHTFATEIKVKECYCQWPTHAAASRNPDIATKSLYTQINQRALGMLKHSMKADKLKGNCVDNSPMESFLVR